jgi:general secretion pathway protein K
MPDINTPERRQKRLRTGRGGKSRQGFALIVVLWGLGIIALLVTTYIATARWRFQASANIGSAAEAGALAEGALNLALFDVLRAAETGRDASPPFSFDGTPVFCSLPRGAMAAVLAEEEGGKININSAPAKLLQALFVGFGVDMREADRLADNIVAFRSPKNAMTLADDASYRSAGLPYEPKHELFQTSFELDQVLGIDSDLFRTLAPFVTVYSTQPGVALANVPPALFAALAGFPQDEVFSLINHPYPNAIDRRDPRFPAAFASGGASRILLLHAEIVMPGGQSAVREAVVDMRSGEPGTYAIKEMRHGQSRYIDDLRALDERHGTARTPPC